MVTKENEVAIADKGRKPRKHHFLPVSYLRNFSSDDGHLYVYERGRAPRVSVPAAEACIKDFYAYPTETGKAFEVEEILSRHESAAAPVIQGIVRREKNGERRLLTKEETQILTHFVALTFVRVPAGRKLDEEYVAPAVKRIFKEAARDKEKFAALVRDIPDAEPISETERAERIEDARLTILNGGYDNAESPAVRLYAMLHVASMIAAELRKYSCVIIKAPKHEDFITGDTPVVNLTEENGMAQLGTSFDSTNNSVWFPIASKICVAWRRGIEPMYGQLPPRGVRIVNRNVMRYAERFIYCSTYSQKLADKFSSVKQQIFLGKNAYIPMWEGKPINP
jgi:uncharacterized protein DUF4238